MNSEISFAALHRLAKKSGVNRVSEQAALELGSILEAFAIDICKEAQNYMMHSKRNTLKPEDIRAAAKKFLSNRRRQKERVDTKGILKSAEKAIGRRRQ